MTRIMSGSVPEPTIAAFLGAMLAKGETVEEIVGAAEAMRAASVKVRAHADCIDTCGTGGDGISTFNVSTTAGLVAAAAGAVVAKHGNRSTTRASGSTEALTHLGIDVDVEPSVAEQCLAEIGIGYLNARRLHPAMSRAAGARRAIPGRTFLNLLGPLTNPAGARRQVLGVPSLAVMERMAEALLRLGAVHAWVVHGHDGLCDLTITGPTEVTEVRGGALRRFRVTPEEAGLERGALDRLRVGSPMESAAAIRAILQGERGPRRDHTLLNAGAALVVAEKAEDLREAVQLAQTALDGGSAWATLQRWRRLAGLKHDSV